MRFRVYGTSFLVEACQLSQTEHVMRWRQACSLLTDDLEQIIHDDGESLHRSNHLARQTIQQVENPIQILHSATCHGTAPPLKRTCILM